MNQTLHGNLEIKTYNIDIVCLCFVIPFTTLPLNNYKILKIVGKLDVELQHIRN